MERGAILSYEIELLQKTEGHFRKTFDFFFENMIEENTIPRNLEQCKAKQQILICVCIYVYIYIHTHTYIYIYI